MMSDLHTATRKLVDAIARSRQPPLPPDTPIETLSAPAFRALVAERLRALERDVAEVRSRINSLLFVVAGAVITQLILRLTA
jgi:hypothetical protein